MIIHVEFIPVGIPLNIWQVQNETEAAQIVGNFPAYLFRSKVIDVLYLCVPVVSELKEATK